MGPNKANSDTTKELTEMPNGNGNTKGKPKTKHPKANGKKKTNGNGQSQDPVSRAERAVGGAVQGAERAVGGAMTRIKNAYANRPATKIFQGMGGKNGNGNGK